MDNTNMTKEVYWRNGVIILEAKILNDKNTILKARVAIMNGNTTSITERYAEHDGSKTTRELKNNDTIEVEIKEAIKWGEELIDEANNNPVTKVFNTLKANGFK